MAKSKMAISMAMLMAKSKVATLNGKKYNGHIKSKNGTVKTQHGKIG
ncbi:MAG TPA: hypothetical protein VN414_02785 [Methanosarcina sp.]|nr:hypothetical protein [Methanosarcina sp.]